MSEQDIKAKITKAFAKIGTDINTGPQHSADNRHAIAHEYFIADTLAAVGKKRRDLAKNACEAAGIFGAKEVRVPGSNVETYSDEFLSICARTAEPAERIDKTALQNELTKRYGKPVADEIIAAATKTNAAATTFIVTTK